MPLIHPNRGGNRKFNEKRKKIGKNDTEDDLSEYENKKKLQNIDDSEKMAETSIEIPKSQLPNGVDWSVKIMPMSHQSKTGPKSVIEPSLTMKRGRGRPSKNKHKNRKIKENEGKRPKKSSKKCFMCNFKRYPFNQNGLCLKCEIKTNVRIILPRIDNDFDMKTFNLTTTCQKCDMKFMRKIDLECHQCSVIAENGISSKNSGKKSVEFTSNLTITKETSENGSISEIANIKENKDSNVSSRITDFVPGTKTSSNPNQNKEKRLKLKALLKKHRIRSNKRQCMQCFKWFSSNDKKRKHFKMVHKSKNVICRKCDMVFIDRKGFVRHIMSEHRNFKQDLSKKEPKKTPKSATIEPQERNVYVENGEVLNENQNLNVSQQKANIEYSFNCEDCDMIFMDESDLSEHLMSEHQNLEQQSIGNKSLGQNLTKDGQKKRKKRQHKESKKTEQKISQKKNFVKYRCEVCDYETKHKGHFNAHFKSKIHLKNTESEIPKIPTRVKNKSVNIFFLIDLFNYLATA